MKVVLVVATGVHTGKEITLAGNSFVIGRDEGCNLRPASPAISKKHCAVFIRDNKAFVKDMGSTNGTFVNDELVTGDREVIGGERLRVGPLDFTLRVYAPKSDSTPLPNQLKAVSAPTSETTSAVTSSTLTPGAQKPVPKPSGTTTPASKTVTPVAKTPSATTTAKAPSPTAPAPKPKPPASDANDDIAAMLLGMDDEDPPVVPEGSTVMEMPAVNIPTVEKPGEKKKEILSQADSSAIAKDLLARMTRRPR
ncbi:MAG: FHA domain-containing protein [Fimbriiglobus sp.]